MRSPSILRHKANGHRVHNVEPSQHEVLHDDDDDDGDDDDDDDESSLCSWN